MQKLVFKAQRMFNAPRMFKRLVTHQIFLMPLGFGISFYELIRKLNYCQLLGVLFKITGREWEICTFQKYCSEKAI